MASGIEAAEVLPWWMMSRATTTSDGSLSARNMASVIRMLAWCGAKTSRSSGRTPAASIASAAVLAIVYEAHLKTGLPSIRSIGQCAWPSSAVAGSMAWFQGSVWRDQAGLVAVGAPDDRSDARGRRSARSRRRRRRRRR